MAVNQYKVHIADTGESFACAEDEFILAAMRRAGKGPIRYGCFGGGCGVCKMRLVGGEVYAAKRMSREHVTTEEEAQGYILTCCVQPRSDVILALAGAKPTTEAQVGGDKGEIITV